MDNDYVSKLIEEQLHQRAGRHLALEAEHAAAGT
jgi:hypothetical protein